MERKSKGEAKRVREGANEAPVTSTWLLSVITTSISGKSDNDDQNIGI